MPLMQEIAPLSETSITIFPIISLLSSIQRFNTSHITNTILYPIITVHIGTNTVIFNHSTSFIIVQNLMDTAVKGIAACLIDIQILFIRCNIGDDENFGITRLTIEIPARQKKRITVKIIQHIAVFQTTTKFLKNYNVLSIISIERMVIISDTITIRITIFIHYRTGFTRACFTENIGNLKIAPTGSKFTVTEHRPGALNLFQIQHCRRYSIDYFDI